MARRRVTRAWKLQLSRELTSSDGAAIPKRLDTLSSRLCFTINWYYKLGDQCPAHAPFFHACYFLPKTESHYSLTVITPSGIWPKFRLESIGIKFLLEIGPNNWNSNRN